MMENIDYFSRRMRSVREEKGWSQAELAKKTGITPAAVSQFEGGSRKPTLPILGKLADVLGVSIDYLAGKSEQKNWPKVQSEWEQFFRGFKELGDRDRELLKAQMDILQERSKP